MKLPKYRAWDHDDKKMWKVVAMSESIYGDCEDSYIKVCEFDKSPRDKETNIRLSFNFQLMQFTGLYDKNGKEIYEGDIVRAVKPGEYIPNRDDGGGIIDYVYRKPEERIFIVEYFGATFAIKEVPKSDKYHAPLDWIVEDENIEVIGNIYENPELLEGTE